MGAGPSFVPGLPHVVTLIELRQALLSYQDYHLLLLTLAGPDLVLRGGWLEASHAYTFRLRASAADGQSGFAQVTVSTNSAPRSGRLAVAPAAGMAVRDRFNLTSSRWVDDDNDLPLLVQFGCSVRNVSTFLTDFGTSPRATAVLPQLEPASGDHVFITARDSFGGVSERAVAKIRVDPFAPPAGAAMSSQATLLLSSSSVSADPTAATQIVAALAGSLNGDASTTSAADQTATRALLVDAADSMMARQALVPRRILPSFLVLAGACLGRFVGSDMGVKPLRVHGKRTNPCLTPRIVPPSKTAGRHAGVRVLHREAHPDERRVSGLPCDVRREGGQSLVIGGSSLVILEGKACNPL